MSTRSIYFLGFMIVCALLLVSVGLQVFDGFIPCPLCTLQRFSFALIGIFLFLGALFYQNVAFAKP